MAEDLRAALGGGEAGDSELTGAARRAGPDLVATLEDGQSIVIGRPVQRWSSRAHTVEQIQRELQRIWTTPGLAEVVSAGGERHVAARTSVLNLVVVAGRPEIGIHSAATIALMAGRHPSRSLILATADPDGPAWLDAQIEAHCVLPMPGVAETCAEMIYVTAGGDTGRHLGAIVVPLMIHDLPVMLWWPSEPDFRSSQARALFEMTDRLVVDGSGWPGSGLERLVAMAEVAHRERVVVADFGLVRQARWREAIASVFDLPDFRPFLGGVDTITVDYAAPDERDADGTTNVVKPVYHVAWLASRLGLGVLEPLRLLPEGGRGALLRRPRGTVELRLRPIASKMLGGTTLRVGITARRRGRQLVADVTAQQQTVDARMSENGTVRLERSFLAPRQREVDLLSQVIEDFGRDPVAAETLQMAAALAAPDGARPGRRQWRADGHGGSAPGAAEDGIGRREVRGD